MKSGSERISMLERRWRIFEDLDKKYFKARLDFLKSTDFFRSKEKNFSLDDVGAMWEDYQKSGRKDDLRTLYLHIPFCISKCNYCCYESIPYDKKKVKMYIGAVKKECESLRKYTKDLIFDGMYVGGGTPNMLRVSELDELFSAIFDSFSFRQQSEMKIEMNPAFSSPEKLRMIRRFGFNKVSFGVQSFDKEVLITANRKYQTYEHVKKAIFDARSIGFDEVNADLMFGLEKDNNYRFLDSLAKLAELSPTTIILYKIMPTPYYFENFITLEESRTLLNKNYKLDSLFNGIKEIADKFNYDLDEKDLNTSASNMGIGMKHKSAITNNPDKSAPKGYAYITSFPSSCLGLGFFSQSHIFSKVMYQNIAKDFRFDGSSAIYTGNVVSACQEVLSVMVKTYMQEGYLDINRIGSIFNFDFLQVYGKRLAELETLNRIKIDGNKIRIVKKKDAVPVFLFFLRKNDIMTLIESLSINKRFADG